MEEPTTKIIVMVPLAVVARFRWSNGNAENLKKFRKRKSLSRQQLVNRLLSSRQSADDRFSVSFIQKLEEGNINSISYEAGTLIAESLGVTIEDLLCLDKVEITLNTKN